MGESDVRRNILSRAGRKHEILVADVSHVLDTFIWKETMHTVETLPINGRRRLTAALSMLVAASALVASAAPSSAFGTNALPQAVQQHESMARHFYRGVPNQLPAFGAEAADVTTVVADQDAAEAAMAYCTGRFKSYDPSTGTYLGYDGQEHACP